MMTLVAFSNERLAAAAALLAARQRSDRRIHSLLPARFEEVEQTAGALDALRRHRTGGIAALDGDELRGYLIGKAGETALMGRTVWFTPESYALADAASPELLRDLYAAQAEHWIDQGYFNHYVMVAADSPLLDAWLNLGFAFQQTYALMPLAAAEAAPALAGVTFRPARPTDAPALAAMAHLTAGHQTHAPVFAPAPPDYVDELRAGYAGLAQGENGVTAWLALQDEEVLAVQAYYPVASEPNNLLSDEGWIELAAATTLPAVRGQGIGRALTAHGLQWAREAGYTVCLSDWRAANLLASRFWPRRGFAPVYHRLERRIDPRVAWARVG